MGPGLGVRPLYGVDQDIANLVDLASGPGLVTVAGLPGVGKTTLVRAALAALEYDGFLTLRVGHDDTIAAASLWDRFGGDPVVLFLDGLEPDEATVASVAGLLNAYPELTLLVTASRPLGLPGERVHRLRPLPVPDDEADDDHPALALFTARARAADPGFDLSHPGVRGSVVEICRRVGGLPLAIELAASRVQTHAPELIARGLSRRVGVRTLEPLSEALAWAVEQLSPEARTVLRRAAVFEAPFSLDAAVAVLGEGLGEHEVLDLLSELLDAHLLDVVGAADGSRFALAPLVRSLALQQLREKGALDEVRLLHARYFESRARAGDQVVRQEWPDVLAALDQAIRRGALDDALTAAITSAAIVEDDPDATTALRERFEALLEEGAISDPVTQTRATIWATRLHRPGTADELATFGLWTAERINTAIEQARASADGVALLEALELAVRSLNITLDLTGAMAAASEGLELATRLDDQRALARFEAYEAMAAGARGAHGEAVRLATSAVVRGREHDDPVAQLHGARMLLNLPAELRPELDPPLPTLPELLALAEESRQPFLTLTILVTSAGAALAEGDLTGAARWLWRALLLSGDRIRTEPLSTVPAIGILAGVAAGLGDVASAVRLRESIAAVDPVYAAIAGPQLAVPYQALCEQLPTLIDPEEYALLAEEVRDSTLVEANARAQAIARDFAAQGEAVTFGVPVQRRSSRPGVSGLAGLTARETEVLREIASGATNREIAERLGLTSKTVMHYSVAIYRKLGVRSRSAAAVWAIQQGLVERGTSP